VTAREFPEAPRMRIKRVYDEPSSEDGQRILVDRLWPRGFSKDTAKIDRWDKHLSLSSELRKWYGHDPDKWEKFRKRYFQELSVKDAAISDMIARMQKGPVTFLFRSKELRLNNAQALREYLTRQMTGRPAT